MKTRFRKWLHDHGHHQLCHVVVRKVTVGYEYISNSEFLTGINENGVVHRVDATVFGGRRVPVKEWRQGHA